MNNIVLEQSKSGLYSKYWRFIIYDEDGLDFCKSIWFATKEVCLQFANRLPL